MSGALVLRSSFGSILGEIHSPAGYLSFTSRQSRQSCWHQAASLSPANASHKPKADYRLPGWNYSF